MEDRGLGSQGGNPLRVLPLLFGLLLIFGVVLLCFELLGTPEDRAEAAARKQQAEAYSYQIRTQADTEAAAERAAIREAARQAGHERALESLPYLLVIGGAVALGGFAAFIVWDLRSQRLQAQADPLALYYLHRLELEQRQLWHLLADLDRRGLIVHERDEIDALPGQED